MGVNYGQRRGRLESINTTGLTGYTIGLRDIKFEHIDNTEIADLINRRLDVAEARFRRRVLT